MDGNARFSTLDGLRGVAAIMVLLYHCDQMAPRGYLGVDLFFALSGFVIARAYGDRLASGMPVGRFVALRLVRLYPMYFVGGLLGIMLQQGSPTMLLAPLLDERPGLYPANAPLWSLVFELGANVAWALVLPWFGERMRLAVLAISGVILAGGIAAVGLSGIMGDPQIIPLITVRVIYSYTLGCQFAAMFRRRGEERRETPFAWLLLPMLALCLVGLPVDPIVWELASIYIVLPALLWLGIIWRAPRPAAMDALGRMSFPLYCIHYPIILLVLGSPQGLLIAVAALIPASMVLGLLDAPAQRALKRAFRLDGRPPPERRLLPN